MTICAGMQWLIDIIAEKVKNEIGIPPVFVDRGDVPFWDIDDFSTLFDNAWHTIDLSLIVPEGTSAILLR